MSPTPAVFEFDAEIRRLEGKIKWTVVYFPYSVSEHFGVNGNLPVRVTVDGHPFAHMLLPSKQGHYLVYNEFIRRAAGKALGDVVHVTLAQDADRRELTVPADIGAALRDAGVWELFLQQPDYIKREQVNHILLAKKEETRGNRLRALTERLGGT